MGQARHLAARAAEFARDHCQWAREVWCLQTSVGFGDTTVGARLADLTKMVGGPRAPTAARYAAALAGADGPALAAVSEQFEAFGDRLAAAEAAAHAATAFNTAGRRGSALTADHRADRLAAECGMVLRPGLRTAALPLKLSGHEREITVLLAQGLSNKAIAEALTMSVRSVEAHIYRACSRLGLSRTELTKLAAEHHTGEEIA
jgi:DNA-binding CsgD family transcriptional regulator